MNWSSPGPPNQLEIVLNGQLQLCRKASAIASVLNEYFIEKVQKITASMADRKLNLSMSFIIVETVRKHLRTLKNKTSISIGQLDKYSVKLVADVIAKPLHHVISLSILQEKFPECWKQTKIVPLHKKGSVLSKENYRPAAILSPFSKVLEKVVYHQIYSYFERNRILHPSLHGYRKGRSTMTALLSLYERWVKAATKGQLSRVVLVDLSAAFDLVTSYLLL